MTNIENIHEVKIEVIVPSHEQTSLTDVGVYSEYLKMQFEKAIAKYINDNIEVLPIDKNETFDINTYNNIHSVEFCIVSKELVNMFKQLR